MRLLIIEDDKELSYAMKEGLSRAGFILDLAHTGNEGEEKASVNHYDAVLLDLNLPDKDGIEILRYLRCEKINVPVIIVSARNEIKQRVFGLELGADDYIVKPFDFKEMTARINAVIRRFYGRTSPEINVGNLLLNPKTRKAYWKNYEVPLSVKEFDILEYIASCHPAIVSSEDIAEHIYDEFFNPFSSVLRVHLANLKKKLRLQAQKEVLQTIKGKGYVLCEK